MKNLLKHVSVMALLFLISYNISGQNDSTRISDLEKELKNLRDLINQNEGKEDANIENLKEENKDLEDKIDENKDKAQAEIDSLKNKIKELGKDEKDKVGELKVINFNKISIFKDSTWKETIVKQKKKEDKKKIKTKTKKVVVGHVNIDSVIIEVKNGYINSIQVKTKEGKTFINALAPIGLTISRFGKNDMLSHKKENGYEYIYINSFLDLTLLKSYVCDDFKTVLTKKSDTEVLYKGVGINSIFDLRLYSDALGVFGDKANGIAQTQANFKHVLHRKNILNRGLFLVHNCKMNLTASKLSNDLEVTDSADFSRGVLLQKNWLNLNASVNVFEVWLAKHSLSSFFVDVGGALHLSKFSDGKDTSTSIQSGVFVEAGVDLNISDNIGADVSWKGLHSYSPQTTAFDDTKGRFFNQYKFELFWNPSGQAADRIFGRVIYTHYQFVPKDSFLQLQFGYAVTLTKLADKE